MFDGGVLFIGGWVFWFVGKGYLSESVVVVSWILNWICLVLIKDGVIFFDLVYGGVLVLLVIYDDEIIEFMFVWIYVGEGLVEFVVDYFDIFMYMDVFLVLSGGDMFIEFIVWVEKMYCFVILDEFE